MTRFTNSYNGRALRIDVGFLREHCGNGVIFEQDAATLTVPHTHQGIHSLKVARPFAGLTALRDVFAKTLAAVRAVEISSEDARRLVRLVIGWPELPESPKPWERAEQTKLDAELETRLCRYFHELGENAYAAFNTMTDIASHPPVTLSAAPSTSIYPMPPKFPPSAMRGNDRKQFRVTGIRRRRAGDAPEPSTPWSTWPRWPVSARRWTASSTTR